MQEEPKYDKLGKIPKKEIYQAPEGYFDSLESRIHERIAKPEAKTLPLINPWKLAGLAVAAAIGLWLIFGPALNRSSHPAVDAEELLSEVSFEDCIAYLESTGLETEEILPMAAKELLTEDLLNEEADTLLPGFTHEEEELLYERYGVTPDENLQKI